jgi:hypothetical protein
MKSLGIEGDTSRDTLATLVGQLKEMREELGRATADNKQHKADNERLRARESTLDQRIESVLEGEREQARQERAQVTEAQRATRDELETLKRRIEGAPRGKSSPELPVGLGFEDGDAGAVRWIEPAGSADKVVNRGPKPLELAPQPTEKSAPEAHPVYTVPANSTLMGSVAMTALIGRIPIDGTVSDPYPFKVIVGPDNLTANGIVLPNIAGAVLSGTASGDWTLSCVRGEIRSITFVFEDGTIRTLPDAERTESGTRESFGWISDPHGIPCVGGERRSNARQYLSSQMLITAAGAAAASSIPDDSGNYAYVTGGNGSALGTVGISQNEAMGRVLAGGIHETSQWVNRLYGQAFAAVYVKPGATVAVHIDRALTLDHDPMGRKVQHARGMINAADLD